MGKRKNEQRTPAEQKASQVSSPWLADMLNEQEGALDKLIAELDGNLNLDGLIAELDASIGLADSAPEDAGDSEVELVEQSSRRKSGLDLEALINDVSGQGELDRAFAAFDRMAEEARQKPAKLSPKKRQGRAKRGQNPSETPTKAQ
jgi:hypothetical protein